MSDLTHVSKVVLGASVFFIAGLIFFLYNYSVFTIHDPDFWWHLKTGELIIQQGGLLQTDPFAFTSDEVASSRETGILKGYWAWQVIAAGLYALFGFEGVFLLNFITIAAMAMVILYEMRRQQVELIIALPLLMLGLLVFSSIYALERPQIISFLFAINLLALLARVRDGGSLGLSLPLLMAAWANFHGGFLVGDLILICFAAGTVIQYRHDYPKMRRLLFWVAVGFGASFLNPNFGLVFVDAFASVKSAALSAALLTVTEYQSTWVSFSSGYWSVVVLWFLILLYIVGLWLSGRRFWPEMFVALFLAFFSVFYSRNIGFFSLAMLPAIGFHLHQGAKLHSWRMPPVAGLLIILLCSFWFFWQGHEHSQKKSELGNVSPFYPNESSDFILNSGLQGRMFNSYDTGGYRIWRLYPHFQVFIDNRGLDFDVWRDWENITAASLKEVGGRKEFEVLLDQYEIDFVVQPVFNLSTGRLTPLLKFLLVKPEWFPIYLDRKNYILVRSSVNNEGVIKRYGKDKGEFCNSLIDYLMAGADDAPTKDIEIIFKVSLSEMLIFVGRHAEAGRYLDEISSMDPGNPSLDSLRNQLNVLSNG